MVKIENKQLIATFSEKGAETTSLRDAQTGREYIWQGDPAFWSGHSPILFPITGGLWNGESRIGNRVYNIPKHGFAKNMTWQVGEQKAESMTFFLEATEATREVFPYAFRLEVCYHLDGRTLKADFKMENQGTETMFFQMGGHPGLNLPDYKEGGGVCGYIRLTGKADHLLRAGEQGCIIMEGATPARYPIPLTEEGLVPVCVDTFRNEALILERQVEAATLLDMEQRPIATVRSTAPVWLFWSPQGIHSPFVCFEPWYGLPDLQGFSGPIAERAFIQQAEGGTTWTGGYEVEV